MVLGGILIAVGPKNDKEQKADISAPLQPTTGAPALKQNQNDSPQMPEKSVHSTEVSTATYVPLNSDNLAFDVTNDGKLDVNDIATVSSYVDTHRYTAVYDFNSDSVIDVADLAEIRSVYAGYPVAEFDITYDGKLDINDISTVSSYVDTHRYVAAYDFNSDAVIDVKDLAMIRSAVALAGTVTTNK